MLIKIDMDNDFDRVKHAFLFQVLKKFIFSYEFVNWIKCCIDKPWIMPLLNGRQNPFFPLIEGLRKGSLLSSILYVVMVDTLSKHLEKDR